MVPLILIIALFGCALATLRDANNCGKPTFEPTLPTRPDRIVGGSEARSHSWPWQIQIRVNNNHYCGASIISREWIISAAHCVEGLPPASFTFRAGRHHKTSPSEKYEQISNAQKIIIHESYNDQTLNNDIAIIRVTPPFTYTDQVSPVCLPTKTTELEEGTESYVTGWGNTKSTGDSNYLQQVMVPIISRSKCNEINYYNGTITDGMICAGYEKGGKDSCQGDSGGPLVAEVKGVFELYGVVSWGFGCALENKPGVYANVHKYKTWIFNNIKQIEKEERQVKAKFQPRPFGSAFREQVKKMALAGEIDDNDLPMGNGWLFQE